ncbi:MAG: hypothetical protein NT061_01980 [Spirochaetes bacterium]|nr:hypothetical protein [Spirochaetota bacterium]
MNSLNGLDRLLEAEKRASGLLHDAEIEASLVIGQAQGEAKKAEKKALADSRAILEKESALTETQAEAALKSELEAYRQGLEALPRDEAAFGRLCASILFPGN